MLQRRIEREELNKLPILRYEGPIHLIDSLEEVEAAVNVLMQHPFLGFDTETKPSFAKGVVNKVALLQLATNAEVYLFRLCKIGIPAPLAKLLTSPNVLKIGVATLNDIDHIKKRIKLKPQGFIDLQERVKRLDIRNFSLSSIHALIYGYRISKSQQLSNWEQDKLSEAQKRYAATDAWACYRLYEKLQTLTPDDFAPLPEDNNIQLNNNIE